MLQVMTSRAERYARALSPRFRAKRKYQEELGFWRQMAAQLHHWYVDGTLTDYWGVPQPSTAQRMTRSSLWMSQAIETLHAMRPTYLEALQVPSAHFAGRRVLEIGCGPLVPILAFSGCERHAVDPLVTNYIKAGFPLFDLPVTTVTAPAEHLPYPDGYFDAVISVNALDHVDDFELALAEFQRVLRPGGEVRLEIEYHRPTVTEPIEVTPERLVKAFSRCELTQVVERSGLDMFHSMVQRFHLRPRPETVSNFDHSTRFATWQGRKR